MSDWAHNNFKVGPNYEPPPTPVPDQWLDTKDANVRHGDPNLSAWWEVYDDPLLSKLLHDSYSNNLTVRAAASQIIQAQISRSIARSELLPQAQTAIAGYSRTMASGTLGTIQGPGPSSGTGLTPPAILSFAGVPSTPITGATPSGNGSVVSPSSFGLLDSTAGPSGGGASTSRFFNDFSTSLNASWELDFWGLFRRNLEAANGSLDQSVANYDEILVLLLANVATQYIEIRTLQRRLELAHQNVDLQEPLVASYQKRLNAGIANAYPGYYQLLSNLENTKALIPQLEISLRQANNQLCILLGKPVHDMLPELGDGTVTDPSNPKRRMVRIPQPKDRAVVVGIPGEYLLRRPDVKASEQQLKIQSAQIGIAEAEMFPHLGINGSIGLASTQFKSLFEGRSFAGSIGPSLTWNILNYGRLLANVRYQNEAYKSFVANYQQAILNANQDAENSLVAYLKTLNQFDHLLLSANATARLTDYLIKQYNSGFLPAGTVDTSAFINQLFTTINFQVSQQDTAAQAEGNIALNLILLYRAMGGGWQIRLTNKDDVCGSVAPGDGKPTKLPETPGPAAAYQEVLPVPQINPVKDPGTGSGEKK